jgi:hypothetical protein
LWFDHWHPLGVLFDKFGYRVIYDSQSHLDAKVDSVFRNGVWRWKPARSDALVDIHRRLSEVHLSPYDKPIWTIGSTDSYINSETWNFLRRKKEVVGWWNLVWFSYAIPKQAFILWLAMHNRLSTGDRLLSWGYTGNIQCVFFVGMQLRVEIISFFPVVSVLESGKCVCSDVFLCFLPLISKLSLVKDAINRSFKALMGVLCRLILSSSVYGIWCARNAIKYGQPKTEEQILKTIF